MLGAAPGVLAPSHALGVGVTGVVGVVMGPPGVVGTSPPGVGVVGVVGTGVMSPPMGVGTVSMTSGFIEPPGVCAPGCIVVGLLPRPTVPSEQERAAMKARALARAIQALVVP